MTNTALRDEILERAKRWPTKLFARLYRGPWRLLGAREKVYEEFDSFAESIARDLNLPLGDCGPKEALLYRLKQHGRYVQVGRKTVISPLRDALIEYLKEQPSAIPDSKLKSGVRMPVQGIRQAKAAASNHRLEARTRICQAFAQLGIATNKWPTFVRAHQKGSHADPRDGVKFSQKIPPLLFQAPLFDRLNQSPAEWMKVADAAWERHRDRFLEGRQGFVEMAVDEEIVQAKHRRGAGKKRRERKRSNAAIDVRYEWAASRLDGKDWKEIAAQYGANISTVTKAASEVLKEADWPTKPNHVKSARPGIKPAL